MKYRVVAVLLAMAMVVTPTTTMAMTTPAVTVKAAEETCEAKEGIAGDTWMKEAGQIWESAASDYNSEKNMWWGNATVSEKGQSENGETATYQIEENNEATEETGDTEKPAPGTVVQYNDQIAYMVNEDGETCQVGCADQKISGTVEIPSELDGFTVTGIAAGGFAQCENVTGVTLPDTVVSIGGGAFTYSGLTSIYIPASVTSIESDVSILVQAGPVFGSPALQSIDVDDNNPVYTSVDGTLFNKDKTTLIAHPAAKSSSYAVPEGVKKIDTLAFALNGIIYDDFSIESFPESLEEIGAGAFAICPLKSIEIPANVKRIYYDFTGEATPAFYFCPELVMIDVAEDNTEYTSEDGVLFNKDMTQLICYPTSSQTVEYKMPDSVKMIASWAFSQFANNVKFKLTKVSCSSNLKGIGNSAFRANYSIKEVELPVSLTDVLAYAFADTVLTDVNYAGIKEEAENILIDTTGNAKLKNANWHYKEKPATWVEYNDQFQYMVHEDGKTCKIASANQNISGVVEIPSEVDGYTVTEIADDGFVNCHEMESVIIPDTVTTIGSYAFAATNITSIEIPASVTEIRNDKGTPFDNSMLEAINVAEGNEKYCSVDGVLFNKDKTSLVKHPCQTSEVYTVPEGVKKIEAYAFAGCGINQGGFDIKSLPDTLEEIENAAFEYSTITSLKIPASVKKISYDNEGKGIVRGCTNLKNIEVSSKNTKYKSQDGVLFNKDMTDLIAFPAASQIEEYKMPDTVRTISSFAFMQMNLGEFKLEKVKCSSNLKEIGWNAFDGSKIKEIELPISLEHIYRSAFTESLVQDVYYTGTEGDRSNIVIDEVNDQLTDATWHYKANMPLTENSWKLENGVLTLSGKGAWDSYAKAVKQPWYEDRSKITSVVIEDGITEIGEFNFYGLTNVKEITIPSSVTKIGAYALKNCSALKNITLPENLTSIGESALYGCGLTKVTIPAAVTEIQDYAFSRNTALKELSFSGSAPVIADHAFSGVKTAVTFPTDDPSWTDEVKKDYSGALNWNDEAGKQYCGKDATWKLENGVLTISGTGAVDKYDSATESPWSEQKQDVNKIIVVDGITSVGDFAFYGMTNLTEITLPDSVRTVGAYAFKKCSGLEKITLPENLQEIQESAFYGCEKLNSVVFGKNVTKIGDYAFSRCAGLKSITFKGDAPKIGDYAFNKVTANVAYPKGNSSWTDGMKKNYGGKLTWSEVE